MFFDGLYGLWNAIYYGVKELQEFYLERFRGVKYFVAPDYSKCGDISEVENYHRQFRSRVAAKDRDSWIPGFRMESNYIMLLIMVLL